MNPGSQLENALSAMTWGWCGHAEERHDLVTLGRSAYGKALRSLRRGISNQRRSSTEDLELLISIELLALYELYEFGPAYNSAWAVHMKGAEIILQQQQRNGTNPSRIYQEIFMSHYTFVVRLLRFLR